MTPEESRAHYLASGSADTPLDHERLDLIREVLADPATTAFVIVLAAERLPVLETIELQASLARAGIDVAALVVNRRSPADVGAFLAGRRAQEQEHLDTLHDALPTIPRQELPLLSGDVVGEQAVAAFADLLARG